MKYSQASKKQKMTTSSSSHFSTKSIPNCDYIFSTTTNYPKATSERMPICPNLSKKIILREGHLVSSYLDHNPSVTTELERQGWTSYALKELDVYEPLVRWFYKNINIHVNKKGYCSTATWSVDLTKDGETISFVYDSSQLQSDFKIIPYGFEDISLVSEKSCKWKPMVDKLIAYASGVDVDISFEEEFCARLVQTMFMPTTFLNDYHQKAQFAIASKLLLKEPVNLPVIMAKHMSISQCDPDVPTIPCGGLVTFIMKKWLLLRPFGIKKESFHFGSDIFDDQWKIIKELMTKDDLQYQSEDEDEEMTEEDPEMMSEGPLLFKRTMKTTP